MAEKSIEFRAVNANGVLQGSVKLEHVSENNTVDMSIYFPDGELQNTFRIQMDSIERQLPASLRIAGMDTPEQVTLAVEEAVRWAAEITGGIIQDYLLAPGQDAVHAIDYGDSRHTLFHVRVDEDGIPGYNPWNTETAPDCSYHVTREGEEDSEGFMRATIARKNFSTHVVRWKNSEEPPEEEEVPAEEGPPAEE